ncbi:MAG: hypothetical protein ABWZ40_04135 [Caulobacterales bacterium]
MTEGEILERLVDFADLTLNGIGVFFTVISAYAAALYYFVNRSAFLGRLVAFVFFSVTLGILVLLFVGSAQLQGALIVTLSDLSKTTPLTAAGAAAIANATATFGGLSTDAWLRLAMLVGFGAAYITLFYLTLFHNWRFDAEGRVIPPSEVTDDD